MLFYLKKRVHFVLMVSLIICSLSSKAFTCILDESSIITDKLRNPNSSFLEIKKATKEFSDKICSLAHSIPVLKPSVNEWLENELNSNSGNRRVQAWNSLEYAQKKTKKALINVCSEAKFIASMPEFNVMTPGPKKLVIKSWLYISDVFTFMNFHSDIEKLSENNKIDLNQNNKSFLRGYCVAAGNNIIEMIRNRLLPLM